MAESHGAELALLLLGGFHSMVDEVVVGLDSRGHPGVRPAHEFALRAIDAGADTASELGRRLSVSKQAAAKTIASLQQLGYVDREVDPSDGRRRRIRVTPHGYELMAIGSALFDDVRERWAAQIGARQLDTLQARLGQLVQRRAIGADDLARFESSGDGLEFIELASGLTVLAVRVEDGWMLESADGTERVVTDAEFEANYRVRAGGAS